MKEMETIATLVEKLQELAGLEEGAALEEAKLREVERQFRSPQSLAQLMSTKAAWDRQREKLRVAQTVLSAAREGVKKELERLERLFHDFPPFLLTEGKITVRRGEHGSVQVEFDAGRYFLVARTVPSEFGLPEKKLATELVRKMGGEDGTMKLSIN